MGHKGHYGQYSGNHPRFSHRQDERYDAKEAYNKDLTASARLHYLENDRHDHESPAHSHCSPMHMHTDRHIRRQAEKIAKKNKGDVQDIYYELKAKAAQDERSGKKRGYDERSGEERRKDIDEMIYERPDSPMNEISKRGERILNQADKARDAYSQGDVKKGDRHTRRAKRIKKRDNPQPPMPEKIERGKGFIPMPETREEFLKIHKPQQPPEPMRDFPIMPGRGLENRGKRFIMSPRKVVLPSYYPEFTRLPNPELQSPVNACAKSEGGKGCIKQMGGAWRVISNKTDKPWPAKYASKAKAEAALRGYHAG